MNKDVIYRHDATNALKEVIRNVSNNYTKLDPRVMAGCGFIEECIYKLEALPSAQPKQKKGKWERVYLDHVASGERPSIFYCSSCNQCVPFPTNFCPACGSDNRQS